MKIDLTKQFEDKRLVLLELILFFSIFFFAYLKVHNVETRQSLIYLFVLASLWVGFGLTWLPIVINLIGLYLVLTLPGVAFWPAAGLVFLLAASSFIPYYFRWSYGRATEGLDEKKDILITHTQELEASLTGLDASRQGLENKIEKINQIYVLGRELVEHLDPNEIVDHLQRVLMNRQGVKAVTLFMWDKNAWVPLYFSDETKKQEWLDFVTEQKELSRERKFLVIPGAGWLGNNEIVFWPAIVEEEMMVGIFLTVEKEFTARYLDEGPIFVPQIQLGFRRTRLFEEVQERSRRDGLTGLYLKRYFLERLGSEVQRAKRYSSGFSILMADIDHFKTVNDKYGHVVGDKVIESIANTMQATTRPGDLVGRYGGEEFIELLPMCTEEETMKIAGKICKDVNEKEFTSGNVKFKVSISIGISYFSKDGLSDKDLITKADEALYWVKSHGRNGVKEYKTIKKKATT
jgi:diguanylate cyclase (GGDEF)-like protein